MMKRGMAEAVAVAEVPAVTIMMMKIMITMTAEVVEVIVLKVVDHAEDLAPWVRKGSDNLQEGEEWHPVEAEAIMMMIAEDLMEDQDLILAAEVSIAVLATAVWAIAVVHQMDEAEVAQMEEA
jgi:hypothetical protein